MTKKIKTSAIGNKVANGTTQTISKNNVFNKNNTEGYMILSLSDDIEVVKKHFAYIAKKFFDKELIANTIIVEYKGETNVINTLDYGKNMFDSKLDIVGITGNYCKKLVEIYQQYILKERENYTNNIGKRLKESGYMLLAPFIQANSVNEANKMLMDYCGKNCKSEDFFEFLVA
jgi:hypothetical protein